MKHCLKCPVAIRLVVLLLAAGASASEAPPGPALAFPLDGEFQPSQGQTAITTIGPHRFVKIHGRIGYQPLSRESFLRIPTDLHARNEGSIILSICPLETLAVAASLPAFLRKDPQAQQYRLLTDARPDGRETKSVFDWRWMSAWHPQMLATFGRGNADFTLVPCVMVEHLPLREATWYQLALTWNKSAHRLRIYVNGILCGTTDYPFAAQPPHPELYLGNAAMAFADVRFYERELSGPQAVAVFARTNPTENAMVMAELRSLFTVQPRARADWAADASWTLARSAAFTRPEDLMGWRQQGCTTDEFKMKAIATTPEGLLLETPDEINQETRMYLWSPEDYEGDIAVQFDFRPEKDSGLALLVVQASGMQREDFITDQPPRTGGGMGTIISDRVRNYHWEFFRRTGDVRADLGTQILMKNPWARPLAMATLPRLAIGVWHRLLFVKEGAHIRGALDGQWVFDVNDDPFQNNGPVLNFGRIGLREMYRTRMRFRNLRIWTRNPEVEIVRDPAQSSPPK